MRLITPGIAQDIMEKRREFQLLLRPKKNSMQAETARKRMLHANEQCRRIATVPKKSRENRIFSLHTHHIAGLVAGLSRESNVLNLTECSKCHQACGFIFLL